MSNVQEIHRTLFHEAHRRTLQSRFVEADDICHQLLEEPRLPMLYRAGCNLLLSFGNDKPVEYAKEAVKWYQEMYDEVRNDPNDGPHHLKLLQQAERAVTSAEEREAAKAEEEGDEGVGEEQPEAANDVEKVSEGDVEMAEAAVEPPSSVQTAPPDSSIGGETIIDPASSQVLTQVDDPSTIGEGKKITSDKED